MSFKNIVEVELKREDLIAEVRVVEAKVERVVIRKDRSFSSMAFESEQDFNELAALVEEVEKAIAATTRVDKQ